MIQVTRLFGLEEMVQVWCVADGSVRGANRGVGRGGWVFQEFDMRDMGGWSWADRLADCLWSQGYGGGSNRLLSLVGEWPEMRSVFAGRCLGGDGNSKHFLKVLRQLVDLRLVSRTGGRKARYRLTSRGYWVMASRDRVPNNVMLAGVKGPVGASARRLALHEDGVMQMVSSFSQGGLATGAGWRWWEGLEGGAIVPDAMVYVGDGPFGPGWHFVEYERYVRGTFRAERKLRGYLAGDRRERWPLLIVVWNEEVEAVFHELGRAAGLHDADGDDGPVEAVRAGREFGMLVDVRPEGVRGQLGRWRVRGLISAIRGAVWGFGRARVPYRLLERSSGPV